MNKLFSTAVNIEDNSDKSKNESNSQEDTQTKKFDYVPERKKIFNKKTHYRNFFIEKKLDPPKTFDEQDTRELSDWHRKKTFDRRYIKVMDDWQKNLIEKKRRKAITKMNKENHVCYA